MYSKALSTLPTAQPWPEYILEQSISCCADNCKSLPVVLKYAASTAAAAEKAQLWLHRLLINLTGLIAPSFLQSLDSG